MHKVVRFVDLEQRSEMNNKRGITFDYNKSCNLFGVKVAKNTILWVKPENIRFVNPQDQPYDQYFNGLVQFVWSLRKVQADMQCQTVPSDFHAWNVQKDGTIQDPFAERLPHFEMAYKPWKKWTKYYRKLLQETMQEWQGKTSDELASSFHHYSNVYGQCITMSVIGHLLHGHEIQIGSLGFVMEDKANKEDKSVYVEFGNFRDKPDF